MMKTLQDATSPDRFVAVGKVVGAHGIRGEVKVMPYVDDVEFLLDLEEVYFGDDAGAPGAAHPVESARLHKNVILFMLETVPSRNDAELLVGKQALVPRELEPELPEGSFKLKQLVGLHVLDEAGAELGSVRDVDLQGARATLDVKLARGGDLLVPFVGEYVDGVDTEAGSVRLTGAYRRLLFPEEVGR